MAKSHKLHIRIPEELHSQLKELVGDGNMSELVRGLLEKALGEPDHEAVSDGLHEVNGHLAKIHDRLQLLGRGDEGESPAASASLEFTEEATEKILEPLRAIHANLKGITNDLDEVKKLRGDLAILTRLLLTQGVEPMTEERATEKVQNVFKPR